ncbi:MAG: HAD family phosphatase [Eubacteriales bacterium]|nr:HAD family phosphatase [Eubacteriales bacterium]
MIKNIIFDVGNVLLGFDPEKYLEKRGYTENEKQILRKNMFGHPLWLDADRGIVEGDALREGFAANDPGHRELILDAFDNVEQTLWGYLYTEQWTKSLKERGYRLYVLSNYGKDLHDRTKHMMSFLPYMDGVVFSYECHLLKPEREIYQYLCDQFHLNPEECVFMDDREENIEAARAYGIHGICFHHYEDVCKELEKLLNEK